MKKVRKPRDLKFAKLYNQYDVWWLDFSYDHDSPYYFLTNMTDAKKLHKWLGQAIKYLEQERKKK